jgi:hypothetical protein
MKSKRSILIIILLIQVIQKKSALSPPSICDRYNKMNIINKINNLFIDGLEFKSKNCSSQNILRLTNKDFCVHFSICYEKIIKNGTFLHKKRIECPCKGKYSQRCGKMYCTLNSELCDVLKNFKSKDSKKFSTLRLNHCKTI